MRFKTNIQNISTFTKLVSCLSSVGKIAWLRLDENEIQFTLMAVAGVQVFATLAKGKVFEDYRIASASENVINLEVPLAVLLRALRSCATASDVTLRLTKRASDNVPILCLTITTSATSSASAGTTLITQEVPVRVLSAASVAGIKEPTCPEPDVYLVLPPLALIRSITERLNRLSSKSSSYISSGSSNEPSRLRILANMAGEFKMRLEGNDTVKVESKWKGLHRPNMNPGHIPGGTEDLPSMTRPPEEFAGVTVDGKEWSRVLKVGGIAKKVVACFIEDHALVLYVYLTEEEDSTAVLTYYMSSFSS